MSGKRCLTANLSILYDVAHNIGKIEEYDGKKVIVHRKGATRSFPNQPVLIPGSMGTASYVLVGAEGSMTEAFGSTCHGAGRRISRHAAKKEIQGSALKEELKRREFTLPAAQCRVWLKRRHKRTKTWMMSLRSFPCQPCPKSR